MLLRLHAELDLFLLWVLRSKSTRGLRHKLSS